MWWPMTGSVGVAGVRSGPSAGTDTGLDSSVQRGLARVSPWDVTVTAGMSAASQSVSFSRQATRLGTEVHETAVAGPGRQPPRGTAREGRGSGIPPLGKFSASGALASHLYAVVLWHIGCSG